MKVVFFHRKPRPNFNFSVENLFKQIRQSLPAEVDWEVKELRFFSEGFFKRLYICFEAVFSQKDINHITGDINFIAILLRKKKTVLTILDVGFMKHPNAFARWVLRIFWIILPVKRSAVITTISLSAKHELLKYVSIDPEKVKVIYVPISASFARYDKLFNKREPVILQIGTKHNKNVTRLVQALQGISCRLEIVGEVNEALALELRNANVKYIASKNLTNQEILEKYKSADILSFVSTYEGFGMPIVEGNAVGRVVVTSNILSMPEVAGDAAHLVDPFSVPSIREGILRVIEDDAYRDQLVEHGFKNHLRFRVQMIAQQFTEIYKSLELR
jgi:glycosyltransferase involved in cell wall biosynthesis